MLNQARFLKALRLEPVDRPPIWIMRQAGRYLPEYQKIRKKVKDFMTLCKTPELACTVTLQPIARFDLDAAIIFSDILTIPDAMGLELVFVAGHGPQFGKPIRHISDIKQLPTPDIQATLGYVTEAIQLVKKDLADKIPLIGFSGSPFTLATYMLEGGSSKHFYTIKKWRYKEPHALNLLLKKLTHVISEYLLAQVSAGADVLMLFDTWGGILSTHDYQDFSLNYIKQIIKNLRKHLKPHIPIILFTKNGGQWLEAMAASGVDALGIDWTTDLAKARARVGDKVALQGNLDPCALQAPADFINLAVQSILSVYKGAPGHIFNLGHGIPPNTPLDSVYTLIDAVKQVK